MTRHTNGRATSAKSPPQEQITCQRQAKTSNAPRRLANSPVLPTFPNPFMSLDGVCGAVHMSKARIFRQVRAGTFPKPRKISAHAWAWAVEDIRDWLHAFGGKL